MWNGAYESTDRSSGPSIRLMQGHQCTGAEETVKRKKYIRNIGQNNNISDNNAHF